MGSRGRKSVAELTVSNVVPLKSFPPPPGHLSRAQQETWRLVIASRAGDMIAPEAFPVLAEYCRWVENADQVAAAMNKFKPGWAKTDEGLARWSKLQAMQERASRTVASLAVKLRLPPSTRVHPERAGTIERKGVQPKPWEDVEDA